MKKGIAIVATLGFAVGVTAYVMFKQIKKELDLGLNMTEDDFNIPPQEEEMAHEQINNETTEVPL